MATNDFLDHFLDLIPPPSPSEPVQARRRRVEPFTVPLPGEILRQIFEVAVVAYPFTAPQVLLVSKWVYAWVVKLAYKTLVVTCRKDVERVQTRAPRLIGYTRNVWLDVSRLPRPDLRPRYKLVERLSHVAKLCVGQDGVDDLALLLPPDSATHLRELSVLFPGHTFPAHALTALTHLRLAPLTSQLISTLSLPHMLPALTHLAVGVEKWQFLFSAVVPSVRDYGSILSFPSRHSLRVFVVCVQGNPHWFSDALLALRLDRLVVLRDSEALSYREWLAECRGEPGFWHRVEWYGLRSLQDLH